MQFVYHMQFPTKYIKYMKMKSNSILYHLYHLLPLLQPYPTKVCHQMSPCGGKNILYGNKLYGTSILTIA